MAFPGGRRSSQDLIQWKHEGVILNLKKNLAWANSRARASCIAEKNGLLLGVAFRAEMRSRGFPISEMFCRISVMKKRIR